MCNGLHHFCKLTRLHQARGFLPLLLSGVLAFNIKIPSLDSSILSAYYDSALEMEQWNNGTKTNRFYVKFAFSLNFAFVIVARHKYFCTLARLVDTQKATEQLNSIKL